MIEIPSPIANTTSMNSAGLSGGQPNILNEPALSTTASDHSVAHVSSGSLTSDSTQSNDAEETAETQDLEAPKVTPRALATRDQLKSDNTAFSSQTTDFLTQAKHLDGENDKTVSMETVPIMTNIDSSANIPTEMRSTRKLPTTSLQNVKSAVGTSIFLPTTSKVTSGSIFSSIKRVNISPAIDFTASSFRSGTSFAFLQEQYHAENNPLLPQPLEDKGISFPSFTSGETKDYLPPQNDAQHQPNASMHHSNTIQHEVQQQSYTMPDSGSNLTSELDGSSFKPLEMAHQPTENASPILNLPSPISETANTNRFADQSYEINSISLSDSDMISQTFEPQNSLNPQPGAVSAWLSNSFVDTKPITQTMIGQVTNDIDDEVMGDEESQESPESNLRTEMELCDELSGQNMLVDIDLTQAITPAADNEAQQDSQMTDGDYDDYPRQSFLVQEQHVEAVPEVPRPSYGMELHDTIMSEGNLDSVSFEETLASSGTQLGSEMEVSEDQSPSHVQIIPESIWENMVSPEDSTFTTEDCDVLNESRIEHPIALAEEASTASDTLLGNSSVVQPAEKASVTDQNRNSVDKSVEDQRLATTTTLAKSTPIGPEVSHNGSIVNMAGIEEREGNKISLESNTELETEIPFFAGTSLGKESEFKSAPGDTQKELDDINPEKEEKSKYPQDNIDWFSIDNPQFNVEDDIYGVSDDEVEQQKRTAHTSDTKKSVDIKTTKNSSTGTSTTEIVRPIFETPVITSPSSSFNFEDPDTNRVLDVKSSNNIPKPKGDDISIATESHSKADNTKIVDNKNNSSIIGKDTKEAIKSLEPSKENKKHEAVSVLEADLAAKSTEIKWLKSRMDRLVRWQSSSASIKEYAIGLENELRRERAARDRRDRTIQDLIRREQVKSDKIYQMECENTRRMEAETTHQQQTISQLEKEVQRLEDARRKFSEDHNTHTRIQQQNDSLLLQMASVKVKAMKEVKEVDDKLKAALRETSVVKRKLTENQLEHAKEMRKIQSSLGRKDFEINSTKTKISELEKQLKATSNELWVLNRDHARLVRTERDSRPSIKQTMELRIEIADLIKENAALKNMLVKNWAPDKSNHRSEERSEDETDELDKSQMLCDLQTAAPHGDANQRLFAEDDQYTNILLGDVRQTWEGTNRNVLKSTFFSTLMAFILQQIHLLATYMGSWLTLKEVDDPSLQQGKKVKASKHTRKTWNLLTKCLLIGLLSIIIASCIAWYSTSAETGSLTATRITIDHGNTANESTRNNDTRRMSTHDLIHDQVDNSTKQRIHTVPHEKKTSPFPVAGLAALDAETSNTSYKDSTKVVCPEPRVTPKPRTSSLVGMRRYKTTLSTPVAELALSAILVGFLGVFLRMGILV
jgi:hypothetical protein